jgi:hypothetical protein
MTHLQMLRLQNELLVFIFSLLNVRDVEVCAQVCKRFRDVSRDDYLYYLLLKRDLPWILDRSLTVTREQHGTDCERREQYKIACEYKKLVYEKFGTQMEIDVLLSLGSFSLSSFFSSVPVTFSCYSVDNGEIFFVVPTCTDFLASSDGTYYDIVEDIMESTKVDNRSGCCFDSPLTHSVPSSKMPAILEDYKKRGYLLTTGCLSSKEQGREIEEKIVRLSRSGILEYRSNFMDCLE